MTTVNAFEVAPVTSTPKTETLIQFVLDETGSMNSCWDTTINGFNEYIGSQATVNDGKTCLVSLNKFADSRGMFYRSSNTSDSYTLPTIRTVFDLKDIKEVPQLNRTNYTPNGGTNLYDAIGTTIIQLDGKVKDNQDVLVVIMTDGGENSSREYTLDTVRSMIADRQAKGWTFVYLGANQDAWSVGSSFGLAKGQTMTYSTTEMGATMKNLSAATASYRSMRSAGLENTMAGTVSYNFFDNVKEDKEESK